MVAFFIYLAVFLLYIIGRCIYSSEWVAQIRARNVPFTELENVSMIAVLLVMLFCQLFLVGQCVVSTEETTLFGHILDDVWSGRGSNLLLRRSEGV